MSFRLQSWPVRHPAQCRCSITAIFSLPSAIMDVKKIYIFKVPIWLGVGLCVIPPNLMAIAWTLQQNSDLKKLFVKFFQ